MKSTITRIISLGLAICLSLTMSGTGSAAGFTDVSADYWGCDDISACAALEIVSGYADGSFKPEDKVTYAQFAVMLTRALYAEDLQAVQDAAGKPWYYPNMQVMRSRGLDANTYIAAQGGWPDVSCADQATTRYEMALMLYNVMKDKGAADQVTYEDIRAARSTIKDYEAITEVNDSSYTLPIQYCVALGVITGMSDGTFSGAQNMTRAQACTVMVRMLKLVNDSPSQDTGDKQDKPNNQENQDNQNNQNNQDNNQPQEGQLANGTDCTEENVLAILAEIEKEYPTETVWTVPGKANNNWYRDVTGTDFNNLSIDGKSLRGLTSLQYGCGGWGAMVSERIFGKSGFPFREVTDVSDIRPGDLIIQYIDGELSHVLIAASSAVTGSTAGAYRLAKCEGNAGGKVWWSTIDNGMYLTGTEIGPDATPNSIGRSYRVFTRYPE